jgi:hypothetical protein
MTTNKSAPCLTLVNVNAFLVVSGHGPPGSTLACKLVDAVDAGAFATAFNAFSVATEFTVVLRDVISVVTRVHSKSKGIPRAQMTIHQLCHHA